MFPVLRPPLVIESHPAQSRLTKEPGPPDGGALASETRACEGAPLSAGKRRYVAAWERYYGRAVPKGFDVHHLNRDHNDLSPANLVAVLHALHAAITRAGGLLPDGYVVVDGMLVPAEMATFRASSHACDTTNLGGPKANLNLAPNDPRTVEKAVWETRRDYDAGRVKLPAVALLQLPNDAPPCAHAIYAGVVLLYRCRFYRYHACPVPHVRKFMAEWCGCSPSTARHGIAALVRLGIIRRDADIEAGGRVCNSYLPVGVDRAPGWVSNLPSEVPNRPAIARMTTKVHKLVMRAMTRCVAELDAARGKRGAGAMRAEIARSFLRKYRKDLAWIVPNIARIENATTLRAKLNDALLLLEP